MFPAEIISGLAVLDVLVVPLAGAAMLAQGRLREFLASRVPVNRYRSHWAMIFSFPILLVVRRNLPQAELTPALAVALTLACGFAVVALFVAIEPPARGLLVPLLLVALAGDMAGLLIHACGVRLGLGDHSAFQPLLYAMVVAIVATAVLLARRKVLPSTEAHR